MKKYIPLQIGALLLIFAWILLAQVQKDSIIFSHKLHVTDGGAECTTCHAMADTSTAPTDNLLPGMETCYQCHDQDNTECTVCHTNPDEAGEYARISDYIAGFPHVRHVKGENSCAKCHGQIALSENAQETHLPDMAVCSTCHTDLDKPDYCYDCHARTDKLTPTTHAMDWRHNHGISGQSDPTCRQCHSENYCLECHQGDNLDRQVHPLNFRNNHSLKAKANKENCYTCHEEQAFCTDCHRQELVMPRTHAGAGWSNVRTGGGHARAARLDMDSCLGCHSDAQGEPICAQCHTKP